MQGYNFTEHVRKALGRARDEAVRLKFEYVGTEHLLLGLVAEREGVACTVLQNLGIDLDKVRQRIEDGIKVGNGGGRPDLPYTSRAKKVLELAMSEAHALDHSYVGTEHLLIGMLREEKGIAAAVLDDMGLTLDDARAETLRLFDGGQADAGAPRWRESAGPGSTGLRAVEITLLYEGNRRVHRSFPSPADAIIFLDEAQP